MRCCKNCFADDYLGKRGGIVATAFFSLLAFLKLVYAFRLRIDSDETQHLHVVWGWTQGLLPYRDFFDNHSPLFQFLCAPLFAALGERVNIVSPMRLAMLPLYFLTLWSAYQLGKLIFSRSVGLWTAIFSGAYVLFFIKSSEVRPDDLWAPLWLLSILALCQRPFRMRHAFLAGLSFGACFATTMKTTVLAVSLGPALFALAVNAIFRRPRPNWTFLGQATLVFLGSTMILPLLVVVFFAGEGALPSLYYSVVQHNLVPTLFQRQIAKRCAVACPIAVCTVVGGFVSWCCATPGSQQERITLVALSATGYALLVGIFWPLVEPEDILPVAPLAFIFVAPFVDAVARLFGQRGVYFRTSVLPVIAAIETIVLFRSYSPFQNAMGEKLSFIGNVLRLTTKGDFVMDPKGESVFRRRPFYYVLEGVTIRRLQLGLIKDDIAERLIATRTPVATTRRLPPRARQFVETNYLPVAPGMRVLGKSLGREGSIPRTCEFDIIIAARYTIVAERGETVSDVDGAPFFGSRFLEAGRHRATIPAGNGTIDLVWAPAAEKGLSPFSPDAVDAFGPSD